jgi:hypothetical protein
MMQEYDHIRAQESRQMQAQGQRFDAKPEEPALSAGLNEANRIAGELMSRLTDMNGRVAVHPREAREGQMQNPALGNAPPAFPTYERRLAHILETLRVCCLEVGSLERSI